MGKPELSHDIFFELSLRPFEVEFLRLQPPTFAIIPETLAPHLEMVR